MTERPLSRTSRLGGASNGPAFPVLPDHLASGLRVVVVGTAVGPCAALRGHHYAGRGDAFWQLLHDSRLTEQRLSPEEDSQLPGLGIGLADLVKNVVPQHGRGLSFDVPSLLAKVDRFRPGWVAYNGKVAASACARALGESPPGLGPVPWSIAGTPVFVLPSSSAANRRADYDGRADRLSWWAELAGLVCPSV